MNKGSNLNKEMFDSISKEYDFINNLITFGFHKKWKKEIVEISKKIKPKKILDLATGTADIAIELSTIENCNILAVDPSCKMLKIGERKIQKHNTKSNIFLEEGNAENLKYSDGTFDIVTIGYGVRNFTNLNNSLNEIYRVLKKDGLLIILETSLPTNPLMSFFYNIHTKIYVRLIGKMFSNNSNAYQYLESSAKIFPYGEEFKKILRDANFIDIIEEVKLFGASTLYISKK